MFIYEIYFTITILYITLIMVFHGMLISIFHTKTYQEIKTMIIFIY